MKDTSTCVRACGGGVECVREEVGGGLDSSGRAARRGARVQCSLRPPLPSLTPPPPPTPTHPPLSPVNPRMGGDAESGGVGKRKTYAGSSSARLTSACGHGCIVEWCAGGDGGTTSRASHPPPPTHTHTHTHRHMQACTVPPTKPRPPSLPPSTHPPASRSSALMRDCTSDARLAL